MYIRKIRISNVRGFREVDLDLSRPDGSFQGWTVLAGRNGSGKSTLLKAMALAVVGPGDARALSPSFADWVRVGASTAKVEADVSSHIDNTPLPSAGLKWERETGEREPRIVITHLSFSVSKDGSSVLIPYRNESPEILELLRSFQDQGITVAREPTQDDWFLAAYGPYRRLSGHAVDAQRLMDGPEPIARVVSLFREDASLVESVGWLREIYLQRLEKKPGAAKLEKAVLNLLDNGLLPDNVKVEHVDSDGLWVTQHGIRLPLRELSDGYRTIAALVMDIVRHLHRGFGKLEIEQASDEDGPFWRILHAGVVLIDEVDLHLHVTWQKRVGFWLKRHFPNIQFIVTTHSPFICQAADPRGLIRLPAPGEERSVEHVSEELYNTVVHGSIDDAVLTELFGLESPYSVETERLREAVAQLEAKVQTGEATDEDRRRLRELRSHLPRTMASSVEQALRTLAVEG